MLDADTAKFLALIGSGVSESRKGWLTMSCPFAMFRHEKGTDNNASFAMYHDGTRTHCFSCGVKGDAWTVLLLMWYYGAKLDYRSARGLIENGADDFQVADPLLDMVTYEDDWNSRLTVTPKNFPEEWLATFPKCPEHTYLDSRGVSIAVAVFLDLRYDMFEQRICFPIRDFHGRLKGLHGRNVTGKELRYRMYAYEGTTNPEVWLGEHWINLDEPLVVVESVFDLARVLEVTTQVVCPLTGTFSRKKAERLSGSSEVYTLFDNDKVGQMAHVNLRAWAKDVPIMAQLQLPEGYKDPGETPVSEIRRMLNGLVEFKQGTGV